MIRWLSFYTCPHQAHSSSLNFLFIIKFHMDFDVVKSSPYSNIPTVIFISGIMWLRISKRYDILLRCIKLRILGLWLLHEIIWQKRSGALTTKCEVQNPKATPAVFKVSLEVGNNFFATSTDFLFHFTTASAKTMTHPKYINKIPSKNLPTLLS